MARILLPLARRMGPLSVRRTWLVAFASLFVLGSRAFADPAPAVPPPERAAYLDIMLRGSLNVSRTKVIARRFMAPESVADSRIPGMAETNFRRAAAYVIDHASALPVDLETARRINRMVTQGLVPNAIRGKTDYRRDPSDFYRWLGTSEARALGERDPVGLAERIHHEISALDAFPDGNGRTARLMADLALLQHGHAPAYYTHMGDYFARGSPFGDRARNRPAASRDSQIVYFREIAARGQARAARSEQATASTRDRDAARSALGRGDATRPTLSTRARTEGRRSDATRITRPRDISSRRSSASRPSRASAPAHAAGR